MEVADSAASSDINEAFVLGLNFRYKFSERLFAQGGLQYSERGYTLEGWEPYSPGSGLGDPTIGANTGVELSYIGVPLFVGYCVLNSDRVKIETALGFVTEFLVGDNLEAPSNRRNSVLLSPQLNLGFEYHFGNKWFVSVEPCVRLNTIATDPVIREPISVSEGLFSV